MTISSTNVTNSFSGNSSTTAFTYTFPINSTSEISVIERSAAGVETTKAEGTENGEWIYYYDNGNKKMIEIYESGNLIDTKYP